MKLRFVLFLFVLGLLVPGRVAAFSFGEKHVTASLVAEQSALVPGQTTTVALRLVHDEHWHTYWQNPGEAGLPTTISWKLPEGFAAGPIQWPVPDITDTGGVLTYGYGGELLLLVDIAVPADAKVGEAVTLQAEAEWLMCKEACIPGDAKVSLALPVAAESAADPKWAARIAAVREALPQETTKLTARAYRNGSDITIRVQAADGIVLAAGEAAFFSDDGAIETQALQPVAPPTGGAVDLKVRQAPAAGRPNELAGLLVAPAGWWQGGPQAVVVRSPVIDGAVPASGAALQPASSATGRPDGAAHGFFGILALAFVGGLILNLMPCVFPVLGIKILGFVQQAGESRAKVRLHGLTFAAGVLVSFWVLAGILIALRPADGAAAQGWGFQLQNAGFDFALAIVMLVFGLSLSGVFEIGGSLIGAGAGLQAKSGYAGSFFSGVLATVVATPCSAPFLAPALGAAMVLPPAAALAAFTAIGVGLALPYLVLSFAPALVKVLPRPGAWMETFKQFMAFPLYATVAFLLWVLAGLLGDDHFAFLFVLLGLVLIAAAVWVLGRWAVLHRPARTRWTARLVAVGLLAGGVTLGWPKSETTVPGDTAAVLPQPDWQPWSTGAVERLRAEGRIVYVDFTARWCVTCQVNKGVVFGSAEVLREFRDRQVAALRADWTRQDPKITAELQRLGRAAVPVNLVYLPGRADPILLPEVLTPGIVLEAVRGERDSLK